MNERLPAVTNGNDFEILQRVSMALYKSGYFNDVKSEAQAIVKVMAGAELGLPAFASMAGIHIIQGKPVLGANVIATLVKNDTRYNYRLSRADEDSCVLEWFENGNTVGHSSFTISEAQTASLTGKDNWRKYPSDMLFARAISRGARRFAPGIFGGAPVYTPDEMNVEVDPEGYVNVLDSDSDGYVDIVDSEPVSEELPEPVAAEPSDNGQEASPTIDAHAWLQGECVNERTELRSVWNAMVMTGLYKNWQHAKNAMTPNDETGNDGYEFPDSFEIKADQPITCAGALMVLDWAMARKETPADA